MTKRCDVLLLGTRSTSGCRRHGFWVPREGSGAFSWLCLNLLADCPKGAYGAGCSSECQCVEENTLECRARNGSCTCKSGYHNFPKQSKSTILEPQSGPRDWRGELYWFCGLSDTR